MNVVSLNYSQRTSEIRPLNGRHAEHADELEMPDDIPEPGCDCKHQLKISSRLRTFPTPPLLFDGLTY